MSRHQSNMTDQKLLRDYLLGALTEDQQAQVEDRAFADEAYRDEIQAVEADLIDEYVRGELQPAEQRDFERMFQASPQRRGKIEVARSLARLTGEHAEEEKSRQGIQTPISVFRGWTLRFRLAPAIAAIVCIAAVSWVVVDNRQKRSSLGVLQQETEGLRRQIHDERSRTPQPSLPPIASLVLLPNVSRSEFRTVSFVIEPGVLLARIEIQLEPPDEFPLYRAELRSAAGADVLIRSNVTASRGPSGLVVTIEVPTSALPSGRYELALKGLINRSASDIGYCYFSVQRK
jgi:hypothetical protein